MTPLLRIKRGCLTRRVVFSEKADAERIAGHLAFDDVLEAVVNAPAIYETLRSRSNRRTARSERLYVIVGFTHEGIFVYTKGALRRFANEARMSGPGVRHEIA